MCRKTIYDARNKFPSLVKLAESGEPVELTRHNKPVAVIISYADYESSKPKKNSFTWLEEFKTKNAELFADFEGLPLPPKEYPDEKYYKKLNEMWV